MKTSILLLFAVAIAFVSCDRRGSSKELLENSISEFNKKQPQIDLARYYPETYTEVKIDSIIANTFKVSIKNYSVMNAQVAMVSSKENERYHRVFESEINVAVASKTIFSSVLTANHFKVPEDPEFWNNATLQHVWVNQDESDASQLKMDISIINPKNNAYKLYELVINSEGRQDYFLIEEQS